MKNYLRTVAYATFCLFVFNNSVLASEGDEDGKGSLTGKISTSDGRPAEFVTVVLSEIQKMALTGEDGSFRMRNIPAGHYHLEISLTGYQTETREIVVEAGKTNALSIQLTLSDKQLQEVVIKSEGKNYKVNQSSSSLRLQTPLNEVPQNIQVVTSSVLADQQVISMSDGVIRNVSGATRVEHWGDMYTNITMRGSQIQAFRNGFNVVNSAWGPLTEDMSVVDRIEFVKGPAGFMLANGDPSGLYNVVTKKPTGQTRGETSLTMGSYDLYRATVDLDGKLSADGKLLYRMNVAAQNKGSFRSFEFNDRYTIAPVLSCQLDEKTKLTAEYMMQQANMSDVGSFYVFSTKGYATLPRDFTTMPPGLPTTRMNDQSIFLNLQHSLNDHWKFTAQAAYLNYRQTGTDMWPSAVNADGTMLRAVSIWDAKSAMTLGQAFLNGNIQTGKVAHRILAGLDMGTKQYYADWNQNHVLDSVGAQFNTLDPNYGVPPNGYPVFDRTLNLEARAIAGGGTMDQRYTGVYAQDELGFLDNTIRLTLAGRYTTVNESSYGGPVQSAKHFTPRIGLSVSIDRQTSVYGLYDQAFTPQSGKLANGGSVRPITGSNTEFGIKKDWAGGRWNTTASIYRIMKNNELTADPNSAPNSGLSVVLGQKRAQGVEFDLRGTIVNGLTLIANYAYTNSEVTKVTEGITSIKVGDVIPGYAKHVANGWLGYKVQESALKGAGISGGFIWQLGRATSNWSNSNTSLNLPDYFKLDGGVFWEREHLKLTLNVFNVLDKYLFSGGYYDYLSAYYWQAEAPRNFRLGMTYKF